MKNKHLNEKKYVIELYLKKYTVTEIAKRLGRHRRIIEREKARETLYLQNSDLTYKKSVLCRYNYIEMRRIKFHNLK